MWRWTAIIMAIPAYWVASVGMSAIVTGTSQAEQFAVTLVPLTFALAAVAIVLFALK